MNKLVAIVFLFLTACGGSEIELPDGQELLVIEGWITNQEKQHIVKISKTVPFDDERSENPITDATVYIDDNVSLFPMTHSQNGVYLSSELMGIENSSYRLIVELTSGEIIQSEWELLHPVSPIDSIHVDSFVDQDPETGEDIDVYFPIVYSNDPENQSNFYRYKGFRNDVLLKEPEELILLSDQFINGQLLPNFIPELRYSVGDEIKIELHSLSKNSFDFLELLKSQTTSLGSSSGTSPAILKGNLININDEEQTILGFFGASAVSEDSILIE